MFIRIKISLFRFFTLELLVLFLKYMLFIKKYLILKISISLKLYLVVLSIQIISYFIKVLVFKACLT